MLFHFSTEEQKADLLELCQTETLSVESAKALISQNLFDPLSLLISILEFTPESIKTLLEMFKQVQPNIRIQILNILFQKTTSHLVYKEMWSIPNAHQTLISSLDSLPDWSVAEKQNVLEHVYDITKNEIVGFKLVEINPLFASTLISDLIKRNNVFSFGGLLEKCKDDTRDVVLARGLSLDVAGFKKLVENHPDAEMLIEKNKIIQLSRLGVGRHSFEDIAALLDVSKSVVDQYVLKGVIAKIIEAKIDQIDQIVVVGRVVKNVDWKQLSSTVDEIISGLQTIGAVLRDDQVER